MPHPPPLLNELIGLIYETAEDPALWPMLLAGVAEAVEEASQDPAAGLLANAATEQHVIQPGGATVERLFDKPPSQLNETQLVEQLIPHFQRALRINGKLFESRRQQMLALGVLNHLPLGVMLVDADLKVCAMNRHVQDIISRRMGLLLRDDRLVSESLTDTIALRSLVHKAVNDDGMEAETLSLSGQSSLSLLLIPNPCEQGNPASNHCCTIFVAAPELGHHVSQALLRSLFGLSPAEARLTHLLVTGKSLSSAASELHISRHTVRTQLKSVFAKTGTNRQPDLVQRVLTSPAMINPAPATESPADKLDKTRPSGREGHLRLACGRSLHYAEYGDPGGTPVLFFHSIVGSRLQIYPDPAQVASVGLRWIVPERPGFGDSDPHPKRRLLDWANDIQQLADHLKLDRYHLAGYSAGGAHAAACAWRHPERVIRTALISTMAPFTSLSALAGMPPTNRMLMGMAHYTPALLGPFMRVMLQGLKRNPEQITSRHIELWPEADRQTLALPGMREQMVDVFCQAIKQGPDAIVAEQILLAHPWGFDPAEIKTETHIWHGDADIHVPISMLAPITRIPNHTLHTIPGMGHYLILAHWRKIFETLVT